MESGVWCFCLDLFVGDPAGFIFQLLQCVSSGMEGRRRDRATIVWLRPYFCSQVIGQCVCVCIEPSASFPIKSQSKSTVRISKMAAASRLDSLCAGHHGKSGNDEKRLSLSSQTSSHQVINLQHICIIICMHITQANC